MASITGSPLAHRYRLETDFDPRTGLVYIEYWNGPAQPILALASIYRGMGFKVRTSHTGPKWEAVITIGYDPATGGAGEAPSDEWDWDMEPYQVSIWSAPNVDAALVSVASAQGKHPGTIRKEIEDAVSTNAAEPAYVSGNDYLHATWQALLRGQEAYELNRAVLIRNRTFSIPYPQRIVLNQTPTIYTKVALIREFGIPSYIQAQMPENPTATLNGCTWGWKVRTDRSAIVPSIGKVREVKDWVFAQWATKFHTVILT